MQRPYRTVAALACLSKTAVVVARQPAAARTRLALMPPKPKEFFMT
jgi:hypothetical protein